MTALVQCLFLIALGGIIWNLRRDAPQTPMVLWAWAWVVAMTASFYVGQFESRAIAALFIPLFPAFLLAGSIQGLLGFGAGLVGAMWSSMWRGANRQTNWSSS